MKKMLLSSLILLLFSSSILIFQISCRKDAVAQSTTTLNKIVYSVYDPILNQVKIFTSNLDGSNAVQVPLNLPGWGFGQVKFSPDGTKLFFLGADSATISGTRIVEIFSANLDGSNIQQISNSSFSGQYVAFLDDVK